MITALLKKKKSPELHLVPRDTTARFACWRQRLRVFRAPARPPKGHVQPCRSISRWPLRCRGVLQWLPCHLLDGRRTTPLRLQINGSTLKAETFWFLVSATNTLSEKEAFLPRGHEARLPHFCSPSPSLFQNETSQLISEAQADDCIKTVWLCCQVATTSAERFSLWLTFCHHVQTLMQHKIKKTFIHVCDEHFSLGETQNNHYKILILLFTCPHCWKWWTT